MPVIERLPHLLVPGQFQTEKYKYAGPIPRVEVTMPVRDRLSHGSDLRLQLEEARQQNQELRGITSDPNEFARIILEVESEPGFELVLKSLEPRSQGVVLACVREENEQQFAVIHVPEGELSHFIERVEQYVGANTPSGKPKHQALIDPIARFCLASLGSFWMDEEQPFPPHDQPIWWEVWLRAESDQSPWDRFRLLAQSAGMTVKPETIRFPDRLVGLCNGTADQLSSSADILDLLGEVRRAKNNPAGFLTMPPLEQAEWVDELRLRIAPPANDAPAVCLLDAGVISHPLIQPALSEEDCLKYHPDWPLTDSESHGTEMAGVALFGSKLADLLLSTDHVSLRHRLESVKILPPAPQINEPELYGAITAQAVYQIEIQAPTRPRAFCMAITTDGTDRGKPSSWSGEIDQLCAGVGDETHRRLIFISAGNAAPNQLHRYPDSNDTDSIQDPAQAWNAITVGASTDLVQFAAQEFPGYRPVAQAGDLSPSSTTSLVWFREWPIKPDIVLEGGNVIVHPETNRVADPDSMTMLSTAHATSGRLLVPFRDTSAATAQAARMAAILHAEYPHFWPETIRALLIHSAEWTPRMKAAFGTTKQHCHDRLRRYGYGVPTLERALYSASNSLTLIAQQSLQPFVKEGDPDKGGDVKTNDMGLHSLPWPQAELQALGEKPVEMRVTLSYFIEPKPGRRGGFNRTRHRYQSHGLRFEVKRPQESLDDFRQRINKAARDEEDDYAGPVGDTSGWVIGPQLRTRGSIHSDWWRGTAADLAACGFIAVYPISSGWWKEKTSANCWTRQARYSLLVSIRTEETTVDLYTPVEIMLQVPVTGTVETEISLDDLFDF